jgi:hypothetical protein
MVPGVGNGHRLGIVPQSKWVRGVKLFQAMARLAQYKELGSRSLTYVALILLPNFLQTPSLDFVGSFPAFELPSRTKQIEEHDQHQAQLDASHNLRGIQRHPSNCLNSHQTGLMCLASTALSQQLRQH